MVDGYDVFWKEHEKRYSQPDSLNDIQAIRLRMAFDLISSMVLSEMYKDSTAGELACVAVEVVDALLVELRKKVRTSGE